MRSYLFSKQRSHTRHHTSLRCDHVTNITQHDSVRMLAIVARMGPISLSRSHVRLSLLILLHALEAVLPLKLFHTNYSDFQIPRILCLSSCAERRHILRQGGL